MPHHTAQREENWKGEKCTIASTARIGAAVDGREGMMITSVSNLSTGLDRIVSAVPFGADPARLCS